jgi:hypothetical protein
MRKDTDLICRSFRQDFPQFVARAEALGVRITLSKARRRKGRARVFWLDGYRQLTGYLTKRDGSAFTRSDAEANIDRALKDAEADRAKMATMTVQDRFHRVVAEMRKITPQYRMIGEVRMPGGDCGHCFFMADYEGDIHLHGIGKVATAKAEWRRLDSDSAQLARFCDALEADFAARADADMAGAS